MCYAIPGKVIDIRDNIAIIDYFGEQKEALIDVEGVTVGDYVYSQGGVIVQDLRKEEALGILESWKETFFRLREKDRRLAAADASVTGGNPEVLRIIQHAEEGISLAKAEMLALLTCRDEAGLNLLYQAANRIRQRAHQNSSCVHGIIEFSNICRNDCAYCGIRKDNHELERYRMEVDEVVDLVAYSSAEIGFKAFVLQSGEDGWYTTERLVRMVREIRERCGVLIILSIGERELEEYQRLYEAGARGVLCRFETSNPALYGRLHTTLRYENRLRILKGLAEMGYIIATGSLIGLPGQSEEDLLDDILLAGTFTPEMYSFGPFIPHPATPLASAQTVDIDTVLKVIAVTRLIHPDANLLVTSAVETLFGKEGARRALMAGGNSMMVNLTPERYRKLYSIYTGKGDCDEDVRRKISDTISLLYSLGRAPTDISPSPLIPSQRPIAGIPVAAEGQCNGSSGRNGYPGGERRRGT